MGKRKPSKSTNNKKSTHRTVSIGCKLRNRAKDFDEIRKRVAEKTSEPIENPNHSRCIECDRVMETTTMARHMKSREHRRRLKDLVEDALLEQDRKNGLY
ncbi:bud site selection protein 20 [Nematocida minor]|uniref:bud site selection protein 20 n=1 Tax=Nematocida minor TaxID=1912983 RepID=UPI00221F08C4|nr:bud site selection protein 20 [Nematocida minor]KAI5191762.1 bud site selection protein 20 [Nematocida minor]